MLASNEEETSEESGGTLSYSARIAPEVFGSQKKKLFCF